MLGILDRWVGLVGLYKMLMGPFNIFSMLDKMLGASPNFESDEV
jgi:hypothetical protein